MAGACLSLITIVLFFSFSSSEAKEILVGGKSDSWTVPSSQLILTQWSATSRFVVGDTLVWKYDASKDSVLEVTKEAFESCNTTAPIAEHKDGTTKVTLTRPGPFYFISGAQGHCEKGQKVEIVVISPRHHHRHFLAPAPSPSEPGSPAVAPSSGASGLRGGGVAGLVLGSLVLFGLF